MIELQSISKKFGDFALENINFEVDEGEYFMLLGPSGAGKSMLLEIIAGLVKPDSGAVWLNGNDITDMPTRKRKFGLVFQEFTVFPHMSVFDNIAYPLKRLRYSRSELNSRVAELAKQFSIEKLLSRFPENLSGGEKQRMVLARTLACKPKLLLLDEPLSSVDVQLSMELRSLLRSINAQGQTIIHVTHDYEEAISLATRVAVINAGKIEQMGSARDVFQNPKSEFIARFTGVHNFFPVQLKASGNHGLYIAQLNSDINFYCYADKIAKVGYVCFSENAVVLSVNEPNQSTVNVFRGVIKEIIPQRFGFEVMVDIGTRVVSHITWEAMERLGIVEGVEIWISFKASAVRFISSVD
ncbi:MAG: ABC transporter ATP-binding protein [Bacteroidales bacterium]|nr:ABC transporter ATP-binding protein [Bacteroidales bacterium]